VTRNENEPQQIVADIVVYRGVEIRNGRLLPRVELTTQLLVLPLGHGVAPQHVDRAMLRGTHQPGAWVVGDSRLRPLLERGDESVLRQVFGNTHVPHDPGKSRDEFRGLDSPDRLDGAMCIGSSCHSCEYTSICRDEARGKLGRVAFEF
jgi:hypothetical protein